MYNRCRFLSKGLEKSILSRFPPPKIWFTPPKIGIYPPFYPPLIFFSKSYFPNDQRSATCCYSPSHKSEYHTLILPPCFTPLPIFSTFFDTTEDPFACNSSPPPLYALLYTGAYTGFFLNGYLPSLLPLELMINKTQNCVSRLEPGIFGDIPSIWVYTRSLKRQIHGRGAGVGWQF